MGRKKANNPKKNAACEKNSLKKWLDDVNNKKFTYDEIKDDISSESCSEIEEMDIDELQKPVRKLLRKNADSKIRKSINIECEWDKCSYETNDEAAYSYHVNQHFIHDGNLGLDDSQSEQELTCLWDLCEFKCKDRDAFRRHLDFHSYHSRLKAFGYGIMSVLSIPICQRDSKLRNIIPENVGRYFCYWSNCTQKYDKFHEFIEHVNHHLNLESNDSDFATNILSSEDKRIFDIKVVCLWQGCNKEIVNIFQMKRHLRKQHTLERHVACPNCGSFFTRKSSFIEHFVRQTVSQRNYQCQDCYRYYPSEKLLKEHSHSHVNKYQCAICGLSCQKKSVLARHVRYRHVTTKPFACDKTGCSYRGKSKGDLESHKLSHVDSFTVHKCEVFQCQYSSKTKMAVKRHYSKVHLQEPQTYQCHCCEKKYMRGDLLSRHLKKDHQFRLAPGHSRFFYKQDLDGYYRLQTKRLENLKEKVDKVGPADDGITYEVANIASDGHLNVSLTMKKVAAKRVERVETIVKEEPIAKKDINEFTVVKTYRNK